MSRKKKLSLTVNGGFAKAYTSMHRAQVSLTFRGYDEKPFRERTAVVILNMDELPQLAAELRKAATDFRDHAQRVLDGVTGKS